MLQKLRNFFSRIQSWSTHSINPETLLVPGERRAFKDIILYYLSFIYSDLRLPAHLRPLAVRYRDLRIDSHLESGSFGMVYSAILDESPVALKKFRRKPSAASRSSMTESEIRNVFFDEATILHKAQHTCVIALIGLVCERTLDGPALGLVMQHAPNKDLECYLFANQRIGAGKVPLRKKIIVELSQAVMYLHSLNIIHRDLKPENVLLDENYHAKLSDFGFAKELPPGEVYYYSPTLAGTLRWIAPETTVNRIEGRMYGKTSDIYSLALISMATLKDSLNYPYAEVREQDETHTEMRIWERISRDTPPKIPRDFDPAVKALITRSWSSDLSRRPTAEEFYQELSAIEGFSPVI